MSDAAPGATGDGADRWDDAAIAAALFAVDSAGLGGVALRTLAGPVRDAWIAMLRDLLPAATPLRRLPLNTSDERLLGGLDLAATLQAGRPVVERGILAQADGGVVLLAMAERVSQGTAARLAMALDSGEIVLERDGAARRFDSRIGVVALDEGIDEERPPAPLLDRLAFLLDFAALGPHDVGPALHDAEAIAAARAALPMVTADEATVTALCATALALGVDSVRATLLALRAARASAALDGRAAVSEDDAILAGRLVLAPRATRLPQQEAAPPAADAETQEPPPEQPAPEQPENGADAEPDDEDGRQQELDELILAAAAAAIPAGLLSRLQIAGGAARTASAGRAGALRAAPSRGRPIGSRRGEARSGARLDLLATLRAAAPWQAVRRATRLTSSGRLDIRADDFRIVRFQQRSQTTAIFVVDASGSSAINRLAEAKGAVELLLADCYVRRDQVALLSFRGTAATLLLPPTSSLVRAKRSLAELAGGGGTPLARALDEAAALADAVRRRGPTPLIILLTDGRANIARDGTPGRVRANDEAMQAARALRAAGQTALLIDTSPKAQPQGRALAEAMGGVYLPLPYADSAMISRAVRSSVAAAPKR